jgi:threonine dehydratase
MIDRDIITRILRARVYDVAEETALDPAPRLSERLGARVLLKREDLQPVFSFKLRGAYNRISGLSAEEGSRGIFAASAGNHAQGVALAAARLGYSATIVMPRTTPEIKVNAVVSLGAEVVLHGDTYDEAREEAERRLARGGGVFVHPYDDLDVIAGQGTIGMELLRQHPDPIDAIFVPVGGGGLLAGIQSYVKHLCPETAVVAVESDDAASLQAALRAGRPVPLEHVGIFADGTAVRQVGDLPFELIREQSDGVVTVNVDEICAAILDLFEDTRVIAEPSGALAVAGMKKWIAENGSGGPARSFVAIVSGANINFHRLRHISERAQLGEEREAIFAVTIPERPGSFRALCSAFGDRAITEFNYRYADDNEAHVFVGVELRRGAEERVELTSTLRASGYAVSDMTGNELAVLHTRHMVGGRADSLDDERLLRFEFPERPGALGRFLSLMSPGWNLTLFHYRNHGGAVGRVLAGIQVPRAEHDALAEYLAELGYPWVEETGNEAYRLFLR